MNMGKCLVERYAALTKHATGHGQQQDSDGKLTREGSHGCRSTGPDTLVGGELMVLERLNEPSVAGWLRESYAHAASKQDQQQRVLPTTGEVAGTRASQPHFTLPLPLTLSAPFHRPIPYTTQPPSPSFSALSPRRYPPAETVSEQ